ncbi:thioesterase domain-containing protein [Micromonospora sp. NPDC005298]|uniref:thioesterase domain-containing protein n=1 Tax=Micromonospora sp. NPDC005298 TaxID=3156873 RepID=UPI0033AFADA4
MTVDVADPIRSPVVALGAPVGGTPVLLVHGSTGTAAAFRSVARHLGQHRPCLGIEAEEVPPDLPAPSVDALARRYVRAIRHVRPDGPYHLAGWSLGGAIAWSMAARLRAEGDDVTLILMDTRPPVAGAEPTDHAEALCDFAETFSQAVGGRRLLVDPERLRRLPDEDRQYAEILRRFTDAGLVDPDDHGYVLGRARTAVALTVAVSAWQPEPYGGAVHLLVPERPGAVHQLVAGWSRHCGGAISARSVPGDHISMLEPANAAQLADALRRVVVAAEQPPPGEESLVAEPSEGCRRFGRKDPSLR